MKIHPQFRCNGSSFNKSELLEQAQRWERSSNHQESSIGQFIIDWLSPSHTVLVTTSGSTGEPKQIALKKEFMSNSALMTGTYFNLSAGNSSLLCLPANYIAGKMMLVRAMVLGLHLDLSEPSASPLQQITKTYDFGAMVPLQAMSDMAHLHKIKKLLIGGAAVSKELAGRLATLDNEVYETFGMTETISHIAVRKLSVSQGVKDTTYFQVLPGMHIDKDKRGCLVIDAPRISQERIVTNDLVNIKGETRFEWLGRFDNMVNSGGVKLIPEQIEAKLAGSIMGRFFLAGISDPALGEKLVLVIEGEQLAVSTDHIKKLTSLNRFELPKEIYTLPQFAVTKSGKVNREETLKLLQLK